MIENVIAKELKVNGSLKSERKVRKDNCVIETEFNGKNIYTLRT